MTTTPEKAIRLFADSAGALLLALAAMMAIGNLAHPGLVLPGDPVLMISMRSTIWTIASLALGVALVSLLGKQIWLKTTLTLWLAFNFFVYLIAVLWYERRNGLGGHLDGLADAFGVSPNTAYWLLKIVFFYLLAGSSVSLLKLRALARPQKSAGEAGDYLKTSCPSCGGHIRFAVQNLGQQTVCPHCQNGLTLWKPDLLKMSCYFCKKHIEFPAHAIGQTISCPHCKMNITLK
jgi:hypothetical protein